MFHPSTRPVYTPVPELQVVSFMYMDIPKSFINFLAAYVGRVPPERDWSRDHDVNENPEKKFDQSLINTVAS